MTPTEESAAAFRRCAPDAWIYDGFNQQKLEEMLTIQRTLSRTNRQRNLLCVLDDCMYDKKVLKGTAIRDLHMNGRHLKCQFINCVQYLMDVGPELRSQIDYVMVLKEPIHSNQVKLWKYFFGIFPSFADFAAVLRRCTENYSALVLDNTKATSDLSECLYWYKASVNVPKFRVGKDIFWRLAEKHSREPRERARAEADRVAASRLEAREKEVKNRVTLVQRQDEHGRTIREDKGGGEWITIS